MEYIATNSKNLYKCDICGKVDNWGDGWQWFGSYRDMEDGEPLLYVCSTKCRISDYTANNLLKIKRSKK